MGYIFMNIKICLLNFHIDKNPFCDYWFQKSPLLLPSGSDISISTFYNNIYCLWFVISFCLFHPFLKVKTSNLVSIQRMIEEMNGQASEFRNWNVTLSTKIQLKLEDINTRWKNEFHIFASSKTTIRWVKNLYFLTFLLQ